MKDSLGNIIFVKGGPLGNGDAILAEVVGFIESFHMLNLKSLNECVVERDSKIVISWGKGKNGGSWRLNHLICEIRDLMREFKVEVRYILRGQNDLAVKLAKWSVS